MNCPAESTVLTKQQGPGEARALPGIHRGVKLCNNDVAIEEKARPQRALDALVMTIMTIMTIITIMTIMTIMTII